MLRGETLKDMHDTDMRNRKTTLGEKRECGHLLVIHKRRIKILKKDGQPLCRFLNWVKIRLESPKRLGCNFESPEGEENEKNQVKF